MPSYHNINTFNFHFYELRKRKTATRTAKPSEKVEMEEVRTSSQSEMAVFVSFPQLSVLFFLTGDAPI